MIPDKRHGVTGAGVYNTHMDDIMDPNTYCLTPAVLGGFGNSTRVYPLFFV
eukprot:SAG11_NODE_1629_length_4547_cov_2.310701_4_plen_51_part_00